MMSRGMANGSIRVSTPPRQDGCTIDDQITCPNQATTQGDENREDEEAFIDGRSGGPTTLALLRRTGNPKLSLPIERQAAGVRQGRPRAQPIMHILIGQPPQGPQEGNQE
jgi:hypothetical protein